MQLNNKSQNANDKRLKILDNFGEEVFILSLLEAESKIEAHYTQMNSGERTGSPDTTHRDRETLSMTNTALNLKGKEQTI